MEAEPTVEGEPAVLGPGQLQACLALDRRSLGGLWSASQWQVELADPSRPVIGLLRGEQLWALASGWLILDELHITAVAAWAGGVGRACSRKGASGGPSGPRWRWPAATGRPGVCIAPWASGKRESVAATTAMGMTP